MKHKLFTTAAIIAALGSGAVIPGAMAQEDEDAVDERDTILVTARKKEESLEDVPSSISVLRGEDAELFALDGIADYIRQIPNAILVNGGPEYLSDISIRGQGGGRQGFSESSTGIYRNGVYIAGGGFGGRSFNRLDFFDLDNVQTYRGPQGALYGRNAVGGAINVISKKPTDETTAEIKAGYESAERYSVSGIVNAPLGENIAARLGAFYIDQNDGFITDVNTGDAVDQRDYLGLRGSLRADLSPSTTASILVEYYDSTAPGFSALGQRFTGRNAAGQTGDADPGPYQSNDSRIGVVEIDSTAVFADLTSDLAIGDFTAIFSYKQRDGNRFNEDLDSFIGFQGIDVGGVTTDLTAAQTEDYQRFVGEMRLASKSGSGVTWLIGADFLSSDDDVVTTNGGTSGLGGLAALATRQDMFVEKLRSVSGFGLVEFGLAQSTSLTLEARVQNDKKDFNFTRNQSGSIILATGDLEESWTRFLPAATLNYSVSDNQIIYLRAASGYRPGGFNTGLDVSNTQFIPYDPEAAYSFEAGWKGATQGGVRFGFTGFYVVTKDVQAVSTLDTTTTTTALQNVGNTNIFGFEADVSGAFDAGPGRLRWGASAATTRGDFSDGSLITTGGGGPVIETVDLSGARVNRTRDYVIQANAFYFAPLAGSVDWFMGGSLQTEGGGFENASGGTSSATGRALDNFFLVDARVGLRGDGWQLSAFGKNLTNEVYRLQTISLNGFFNEPRKYGVELKVSFGK